MKNIYAFTMVKSLAKGIGWVFILIMQGCTSIPAGSQIQLPQQDFSAPAPAEHSKVVLYNTTNKIVWPASHRIIASFNSELTPEVPSGSYVILYLPPAIYEFTLSHWDLFNFSDTYELEVTLDDTYIRIFNGIVSTKYEIVDDLPDDFETNFTPLHKCCS